MEQMLSDPELISLVGDYDETAGEYEQQAKPIVDHLRDLKERIGGIIERLDLAEGIYRVGEYVFNVKMRGGGGFEVPEWSKRVFTISMFGDKAMTDGSRRAD